MSNAFQVALTADGDRLTFCLNNPPQTSKNLNYDTERTKEGRTDAHRPREGLHRATDTVAARRTIGNNSGRVLPKDFCGERRRDGKGDGSYHPRQYPQQRRTLRKTQTETGGDVGEVQRTQEGGAIRATFTIIAIVTIIAIIASDDNDYLLHILNH
jgi:hypothetical protein